MTRRRASFAHRRGALFAACAALLCLTLPLSAVAQKTTKGGAAVSATAPAVGGAVQVTPPAVGVSVAAPQVGVTAAVPAPAPGSGVAVSAATTGPTPPGVSVGAPAGPGASAAAPGSTGMSGATYAVRLRDLEARVDELKDQIRRSHTRLALLSDTILSGGAAGSRSEISLHNEMSSAFRLTRALVVLDGAVQYNRADDTGALADQKEIPVFSGSVPPGDHTVSVLLNFQGNGYGVFTYLRGYKFEVKSSHSFTAVEGKTLTLVATALEKGGVTTPLEQRPGIEWQEKVQSLGSGVPTAGAPGASGAAGAPAAPGPAAGAPAAGGATK
jgi:hypothetical protein